MVNVLVTDPLIVDYLDEPGWEVLTYRRDEEVVARLSDVDVLIALRVTSEMAEAAKNLRLLHVPGAGLGRIALDARVQHVPPWPVDRRARGDGVKVPFTAGRAAPAARVSRRRPSRRSTSQERPSRHRRLS
jgi:phosphoglycerate dehydrogenase-like enzyme